MSAVRKNIDYLRPEISVTQFGAVGDGVTDDTAALQNAINSLSGRASGAALRIPAGIYIISATLNLGNLSDDCTILGDGWNTTVIKPITGVTTAIAITGNNQTIQDILFDCSHATSCVGMNVGSAYSNFKRISISGASIGLYVTGGVVDSFENFNILQSKTAGVELNSAGNDYFFDKIFISNYGGADPSTAGFYVLKGNAVYATGIDVLSTKKGLLIQPSGSTSIEWHWYTNCVFDTCSDTGVRIYGDVGTVVKGISFTNSWASSCNEGVYVAGSGTVDSISFLQHRSYSNATDGYGVGNGNNISFVDCQAIGNGISSPNVYAGFSIAGGVTRVRVVGCRSGNTSVIGGTQANGLVLNPGASDYLTIVGNDFSNNGTNSLVDLSTGLNKQILGNMGYTNVLTTVFTGSDTWNPGFLANLGVATKNVTATGASVGDVANASLSSIAGGYILSALVTSTNTVTVTLMNVTGANQTVASGTVRVAVIKIT
jgi:hypothetical protein